MRKANRLASEKSPYLLQHAHNPVDWFPWGEEAFAAARERDVPIFLSIGYATCHWCHVMERESFENEAVAEVLNAGFVAIKVDREERPDVDRLYMTSMQAMRMGGGWPLNVFLTPDLVPFFGGTYIPPTARGGRSGMLELLPRVSEAWATQRDALIDQGNSVLTAVSALAAPDGEAIAHDALVREGVAALTRAYDPDEGGFGSAPKFPSTVNLALLLAWWARAPRAREDALVMVRRQLDAMRAGGIHDHLGGGFHRYSTDEAWLVPHFEKMLYDQALIAESYLDAFAATGEPAYAATARGVFDYVARDLTSPEGAFYSAEDADSEGEEGRFYVWTPDAIAAALTVDEAALVTRHWNVTLRGNFEHGATILHERASLEDSARALGLAPEAAAATLERARAKLLAVRSTRPRPLRDDKVLAAWNGLMIAALARGAVVLGEPGLAARAARAATFVDTQLRDRDRHLARRWREGEAAGAGQLDDHAYLAYGMLALWDATHEPHWLERAIALTEAMLARFWDEKDGACFESPAGDASVLVRMKDGFDGAEMAGNSIAADNLVRLAALLDREDWLDASRRLLDYYARRLAGNAWAMPRLLVALERAGRAPRHVVIAGEPGPARAALIGAFRARWRPGAELIVIDAANRGALSRLVPFAAAQQPLDGRPTAFVCEDYTCRLPVTDPSMLAAQLDESAPAGANEEHA